MSYSENVLIMNARIVLENRIIEGGGLHFADGRIRWIGTKDELTAAGGPETLAMVGGAAPAQIIDAQGGWLLPGFIDVHVHGGAGYDFMDATEQAYDEITTFHGRHGTTAMLVTTVTAPREDIERVLDATRQYMTAPMPGARLAGVHLEGPFINARWSGAQNPAYIVPPNLEWMQTWVSRYPGVIRQLTLAPEQPGAEEVIRWTTAQNIVCACGHTDATFEQITEAVSWGLRHAVHTYNAMTPLHHRQPGTVGAVLTDDLIAAEIIADGHHVHPRAIELLVRSKPADKLVLITDAIMAAGLGNGEYVLGGLSVVVEDGVARLKEGNSLAGSTLTMIGAFRYMVREVGVSVMQASRMASGNPARAIGLYDETGSIAAGKTADLVLASPDNEFAIRRVWSAGNPIYQAPIEPDRTS